MARPFPDVDYEAVKRRYAAERKLRLALRPPGAAQYQPLPADLSEDYDPSGARAQREPVCERVDVAIVGGGLSALMVATRLAAHGSYAIRIIDRGADFGGTWYWNRYPGAACDSVSFDYMPMLDDMDYVPRNHYASGEEIFGYCRMIAERHGHYGRALFQTTVIESVWDDAERVWRLATDCGDAIAARFLVCANGSMAKPKIPRLNGAKDFRGHAFHTSRWDYDYTGADLEKLADKRVGVIGTGASAVQIVPALAKAARQLDVFQRTPSSISVRRDEPTDPNWARKLGDNWQAERRAAAIAKPLTFVELIYSALEEAGAPRKREALKGMSPAERAAELERANIDYMMLVHRRIDDIVTDPATADALKPWYMYGCKRPCIHNDYLPAFNRPNVRLIDTKGRGLTELAPAGPVFDGKTYPVDLLIYATGFEVQKPALYNAIIGRDGDRLDDKFRDGVQTFLGIYSANFPNLFIVGGRQSAFQFNITEVLEPQSDYIAACLHDLLSAGVGVIEPKPDVEGQWVAMIVEGARAGRAFTANCTPGYYNNEGDATHPRNGNFPGPLRDYLGWLERSRQDRAEFFNLSS